MPNTVRPPAPDLRRLAGALTAPPQDELTSRVKASARVVAKGELLHRADVSAFIQRTARVEGVTVDRVIAEAQSGVHGEQLQKAVEEEYERAMSAARDVVSVVTIDEVEKVRRTQEVIRTELAELSDTVALHKLVGEDGLVAKERMDVCWGRIMKRIRDRRATDLAHLDHDEVLKRLDEEADPAHVRDRNEHEARQADLQRAREVGAFASAESRIRKAVRASETLEVLACKAFPAEDKAHAVAKFLATDEGARAYDAYLRAAKPTLS